MNLVWLKLIKRILTHKYYVAKYCFQIGLYWQGITHDLSKFSFTEFSRAIKYWDDKSHYVEISEGQYYGAYYMLGKIFGWNTTVNDYRYPSTKVGLLYGDSITLERQRDIYARLENAHMAACNLVLGIGSYTYQFKSRDSLGFAVKATACMINGILIEIYKHPKTDDGTKNSLKGLIRVEEENGKYVAYDQQTEDAELGGCLKTVFINGELVREYSLSEIRERVNSTLG